MSSIAERIDQAASPKPRFYITWNRYEIFIPQSFDVGKQSSELAQNLRGHGFQVLGGQRLDGAGWGAWRIQAGQALMALLPKR